MKPPEASVAMSVGSSSPFACDSVVTRPPAALNSSIVSVSLLATNKSPAASAATSGDTKSPRKSEFTVFSPAAFSSRIEFEDNILNIFNNILLAQKAIAQRELSFLEHFPVIHDKEGSFGALLKTYSHILSKGH